MHHLSLRDRCVQNRSNPEIHSRNLIFWEQLPLISTAAELELGKYCTKLLVPYQAGQFREISGLKVQWKCAFSAFSEEENFYSIRVNTEKPLNAVYLKIDKSKDVSKLKVIA